MSSILEPFDHATFQDNVTVKILMKMGFMKQVYLGDNHYHLDKNGIGVVVEILDKARFRPSIMLEDCYSIPSVIILQPLNGIKDLTDLEDFISYL